MTNEPDPSAGQTRREFLQAAGGHAACAAAGGRWGLLEWLVPPGTVVGDTLPVHAPPNRDVGGFWRRTRYASARY